MSVHSLNFHLNCANKLCRVCSNRVEKFERGACRAKSCTVYAAKLFSVFAIDTSCDIKGVHSEYFCSKCYYTLVNAYRQPSEVKKTTFVQKKRESITLSTSAGSRGWRQCLCLSAGPAASSQVRGGVGDLPNAKSKHVLWLPLLWILKDWEDVTHFTHNVAPVDS